MWPVQPERSDEGGHGVGVVGKAEGLGWIRRLAVARCVPRDDGELVGKGVELPAPCSAIAAIAPMEKALSYGACRQGQGEPVGSST
jgi:hypothetical protein